MDPQANLGDLIVEDDAEEMIAPDVDAVELGAVPNPYPLKFPVSVTYRRGGDDRVEMIEQIKLKRATAKDLLLIDRYARQPMQLMIELIAALSGHPVKIIERLDAEDLGPLGELAFSNVPSGPATGASSSAL